MDGEASHDWPDDVHRFSAERFGDLRHIGSGQNAAVYMAVDGELQRSVALKMAMADAVVDDLPLDSEVAHVMRDFFHGLANPDGESQYTLLREARLAAKVHHPGVVSVLEVGRFTEDGCLVVIMPLLVGAPLPTTAPWRSILDCVLQLAGGLAALHEAGIVHRDLKPDNVLYDDAGRPCIADLGLACELSDEAAMNHFAGSSMWMAPEVLALGGGGGVQNDIFAFSMIAFDMFYGHLPFVDEDAKAEGRISDIKRSDDMPDSLRDILVKGLAPDPALRWGSMSELIAALEHIQRQAAAPAAKRRPPKRRWLGVAAAAGLSVGLGAGMYVTLPEAKADGCDEVSRELVDFWNADVQAELRVVLGTRKAGDYLEGFASRWVAVRAKECDAAKRNGQADRASPCSTSVRSHLNATISTLRTPHQREGVDFEKVLASLPEPEYCLDHPEDAEYGLGGFFELRNLDLELEALLASGQLDLAERRQADYMLAAREISATYDIARAIYWRAELHRLRGELDQAEGDFKRAYSEAQALGAAEFEGDAMMKLAAVAGAQGELAVLEERAFVARTVFAQRRPDKIAALLQVQGLALVERDPAQRDRGLALLRDAVEMREAQHSRYGGSRERVGEAFELLARGLLAAEQADEAVQLAKQSLAIHQLEYGAFTKRAHELRRLVFRAQVGASLLDDAQRTLLLLRDHFYRDKKYERYLEETLWIAEIYALVGREEYATNELISARQVAARHGLADIEYRAEQSLRALGWEP